MLTRTQSFYEDRLQKHFDKYYKPYDETAEFEVNPDINKWRFRIPELGLDIRLTCNDVGRVIEKIERY